MEHYSLRLTFYLFTYLHCCFQQLLSLLQQYIHNYSHTNLILAKEFQTLHSCQQNIDHLINNLVQSIFLLQTLTHLSCLISSAPINNICLNLFSFSSLFTGGITISQTFLGSHQVQVLISQFVFYEFSCWFSCVMNYSFRNSFYSI